MPAVRLRRRPGRILRAAVAIAFSFGVLGAPVGAAAASDASVHRVVDLDGRPIALADVGRYFCHDFAHPLIHCYTTSAALESAVGSFATTSVSYVVVYEYPTYQGAYMYMADDYTVLATIGWNDRISSYRVLNSMSGKFWTDWFYGGTGYYFCCNSTASSLGSFDNTFSSVFHY